MSETNQSTRGKRRVHHFAMMKQRNQKIVVITAYDYPTGMAADEGGADAVLVGDSLGVVALGYRDTIPVTMEDMIHHTAAVHRGVKDAFLVSDLPFMSYKINEEQALTNAGRLVQMGGAEAVKLEGGREVAPMIKRISQAGIPVMGHLGLTPQSVHRLGGYRVQGRHDESASALMEDALAVEEAGAFSLVLEAVDPDVAAEITEKVSIPTVGIGAGKRCSGQVLVMSDMVGLSGSDVPKFVKQYADMKNTLRQAVADYAGDVRTGNFPEQKHEY